MDLSCSTSGQYAHTCWQRAHCTIHAWPLHCKNNVKPVPRSCIHHRSVGRRHAALTASALLEEKGGAGVLDRPDLDLSKLPTPSTEDNLGGGERQKSKKVGGGDYRIMLLDHQRHTEKLVVQAITTVIPGTAPEHALNCFNTARRLGQAIITSCIKEVAEFYSEQLARQGVSNKIEPDTTTL